MKENEFMLQRNKAIINMLRDFYDSNTVIICFKLKDGSEIKGYLSSNVISDYLMRVDEVIINKEGLGNSRDIKIHFVMLDEIVSFYPIV